MVIPNNENSANYFIAYSFCDIERLSLDINVLTIESRVVVIITHTNGRSWRRKLLARVTITRVTATRQIYLSNDNAVDVKKATIISLRAREQDFLMLETRFTCLNRPRRIRLLRLESKRPGRRCWTSGIFIRPLGFLSVPTIVAPTRLTTTLNT